MKTTNILFKQHLLDTSIKYDLLFQNLNKLLGLLKERAENVIQILNFQSKALKSSQCEPKDTFITSVQKFKELERIRHLIEGSLLKEYGDFKIADPRLRMYTYTQNKIDRLTSFLMQAHLEI